MYKSNHQCFNVWTYCATNKPNSNLTICVLIIYLIISGLKGDYACYTLIKILKHIVYKVPGIDLNTMSNVNIISFREFLKSYF
jgi:hypothetical protein